MWVFSLITVILSPAVKISALCLTVRDHDSGVHPSPLPPLETIQSSLEIKCSKRFNKVEKGGVGGGGNPDISHLISGRSRIKPECIHQSDEMCGLFKH